MFHCHKNGSRIQAQQLLLKIKRRREERRPALVLSYRSDKVTSVTTHCWKLETDDPNSCQNLLSALSPHFPSAISN